MNKQNYKEVSTIGRWGRMHGRYLKDNHPVRYTVLLLSGKLNGYLVEFDQQAKKQLELIVQQMAEREDVTEELKASDQIAMYLPNTLICVIEYHKMDGKTMARCGLSASHCF